MTLLCSSSLAQGDFSIPENDKKFFLTSGAIWRGAPRSSDGYVPGSRNGILESANMSGLGVSIGLISQNHLIKGLSLEGGVVTRVDLFDDFINGDGANTVFVDLYAGILKPIRIPHLTEKNPISIGVGWYLINAFKKAPYSVVDPVTLNRIEGKVNFETSCISLKVSAPVWRLQVEYARLWSYGYYFFSDPNEDFNPYFHTLAVKYPIPLGKN